jgi:SAM-dependent methyltransferase
MTGPRPELRERLTQALRCPRCATPFGGQHPPTRCDACGFDVPLVDGVPILVADPEAHARQIEEARAGHLGDWYEAEQGSQLTGPYRHHLARRRAYVTDALRRHRPERSDGLLGLDLGCGDGNNLPLLRDHVDCLAASDYNLARLVRATGTPGLDLAFLADVTAYPTNDGTFDVVFFNHVLEHIPDDLAALREVRRILRPGGIVVLGVPNEGAACWRLAYRLQPETRRATDHVHFYDPGAIRSRCVEAGFEVREEAAMGWGLPHWSLDARVRSRRSAEAVLERVGRVVAPGQASSLYLVLA